MICLALALALAPAPVPLPAPTLKGLQPMPQKGCSNIAWQQYFKYLASDNRSRPDVLLSDYGPGRMVFFLNAGNPGIQKMRRLSSKPCKDEQTLFLCDEP